MDITCQFIMSLTRQLITSVHENILLRFAIYMFKKFGDGINIRFFRKIKKFFRVYCSFLTLPFVSTLFTFDFPDILTYHNE